MAYDTNLSIAAAKAAVDAVVDRFENGTGANAKVRIYDGTQPTGGPDATVGAANLLAEIDLGAVTPIFSAAGTSGSSATSTASGILPKSDTSANTTTTRTATWFRALDQGGNAVIDGTVGTSGTDMTIDNTSIAPGQTVVLNTWKIKLPKNG